MVEKELNLSKKGLDYLGGFIDDLFLSIPRFLKSFKPKRDIDRSTYEKQIDFIFDNGYANNPESFFTFPEKLSKYIIIQETPYSSGTCQVISFPSDYETRNPLIRDNYESYEANKNGYLVRWTHGDKGRKTVLCLHGFMLGEPAQAERMFNIRKLFDLGLDVALHITPFHWRRAPKPKADRGIFLQPDNVVMTCECFGQAIYDLHNSLLILEDMGASEIGLLGASLGGYITSLFSCLSDRHSFAAMIVPAVNFSSQFGYDVIKMPFKIDDGLKKKIMRTWELHSPLNFMPKITKDKIIFIACRGDKLCPFENVQMICKKWDWPKHRFLTGGHWVVFNNKSRGRAWYQFLGEMGFI